MKTIIKVCGMTQGDNIQAVEALGVDWMGFIFYDRSPRHVVKRPCFMLTLRGRGTRLTAG